MTITNFSATLDADNNSQNGYTSVMVFAKAGITDPPLFVSRMRVTFQAGSTEAFKITNAYIGHSATTGDVYDFVATPVQLLFSGAANVTISAGQSVTSDWAWFSYNPNYDLIVAFYCDGGAGADMCRYKASVANTTRYYKLANDAATVDKTGYSSVDQLILINKIESDGDFSPGVIIFEFLGTPT